MELFQIVKILPSLQLHLLHNSGAAFSILSDASGWQRWFFTLIALAVSAFILYWLSRLKDSERWMAIALCLILGGAIGNVVDRIMLGFVVDFIEIYYGDWSWPAFNVADSAITVGASMAVIDAMQDVLRKKADRVL
jgi:signal peptidase II